MSRTLPIRRKVLLAFLLPTVALTFVTGQGVYDATREVRAADAVVSEFSQMRALQAAAVAVGTERIVAAVADVEADDVELERVAAVEATDAAIAEVAVFQDSVLLDRVWSALSAARATPVGRYENFGRASSLILERSRQLNVQARTGPAERGLQNLQTMHSFLDAEDTAWVGFIDRTSEDLRSSAVVLEDFAVSAQLRDALAGSNGGEPIQAALSGTAVMVDLRVRAIEDVLNSQQMIVTDEAAILSHRDARVRWLAAIDGQGVDVGRNLVWHALDAEQERNVYGLFGLFGLLLLGATGVALAQSIVTPIAIASSEANKLVTDRLPSMSSSFGTLKQTRPKPLSGSSDDEIGQLVESINAIQNRFFDVAEQESTNRRIMSGRTVTIANRNAVLLHELVRNVSAWRNADESPEVRKRLFGIDHIATRMQRNIEAGLVLGGGRSERRWTKPISAINTARLALGEVTEFSRVDISPMEDVRLHGIVAPDVAHVLAELIDNGLKASVGMEAARTRVIVEGEWVPAGWAFIVHDNGSGMEDAERDQINQALHTPGLLEDKSTTSLGLILVGKTAARFGIDIRLIERPAGGTTARIVLPVDLIDPDTVPSDRKNIDAGRGAAPDADPNARLVPTGEVQEKAADIYFAEPAEPEKKRRFGRRKTDPKKISPISDVEDGVEGDDTQTNESATEIVEAKDVEAKLVDSAEQADSELASAGEAAHDDEPDGSDEAVEEPEDATSALRKLIGDDAVDEAKRIASKAVTSDS